MSSSWINIPDESDFSLANIPFGVASFAGYSHSTPFCTTAVGNHVINLAVLEDAGAFDAIRELLPDTFQQSTLNAFVEQSPVVWPKVRARLVELFREDGGDGFLRDNQSLQKACMYEGSKVQMHLPVKIGEYTDFYSSREHATNVGVSI
ncbi:Fumarylacetoacetase [Seminavis robusta]|uniref:Fumarylacetoacetase n=1 Tax=Seminavis robusta TaxID=568900 RepID=A0A9N8DWU8_9STRA|nr:Fumarylacetoacetase [Seminavis robusta]|eukprot:Sro341_g121510.1 Fumarylacetoacetase (149) ;mRNA; f:48989-49435